MRQIVGAMAVAMLALGCNGGGGSGTGGGSGGGSTGGGSGGGTGGGSGSGVLSFLEVGFDSPAIATSADGAVHLAYTYGLQPAHIVYRHCAGSCDQAASWSGVTVADVASGFASYVRLVVASDGRVHLLYQGNPVSGSAQTFYATCAANCAAGGSWASVELTSLLQGTEVAFRGATFVVDSAGRISFITQTLSTGAPIRLSTCASGCESLANWQSGVIRTGGNRTMLATSGTTLHLVMNNDASALVYRTCASNCTVDTSWQESPPLFAHDGYGAVSVVATATGGVRVAYNQGTAASGEPPAVQMQNNKVLVWSCDANCLTAASWTGVLLGAEKDGADGLSLGALGNSLVLAVTTDADQTVTARICDMNCGDSASWQSGVVDSATSMNAEADPYQLVGCTDSSNPNQYVRPIFAGWYPYKPAVAVTPSGAVAVVHAPYALRTCSGSSGPTRLAGIGRFAFLK